MNTNIYEVVPETDNINTIEKQRVLEYFMENQGTFFTASHISRLCGMKSTGTCVKLRHIIAALRDEGEPIVSTSKGFCYTNEPGMIEACIDNLTFRINGIYRAIEGLKRARSKLMGQEEPHTIYKADEQDIYL